MEKKKAKKTTNKVQPKKKPTKKTVSKKKVTKKVVTKKVKRRRLRLGRVLLVLLIFGLILYILSKIFSFPIKNIYISGNEVLTDQEIIELASLEKYPSYFTYTKSELEAKLEKNTYIIKATVKKKKLKEIYITIEENKPLFYDQSKEKTILKDKTEVDTIFSIPILLNYVPDTIYDEFLEKFSKINEDVFYRISEIKYDPNEVDEERFLFTMNDGNYVYINLDTMEKIDNYVDIMKEVRSKYQEENGILFLDEGEYFEVFQ